MVRTPLRDRARGRWPGILAAIGVAPSYLTRRNGPCPLCPGGRDRWRFLDTDGNGTWICTHCGAGDGIGLGMRFTGMSFKDAAQEIERVIGDGVEVVVRQERDERHVRADLNRLWISGRPVRPDDPTGRFHRSRGIILDAYPPVLRTALGVRYHNDDASSIWPAMLAMVVDPAGKPVTIHRTYLTADGSKAPVEKPRKVYSKLGKSYAVRLTPPARVMGVAEGTETALSASILFKVPCWSALCANGLESFEPPPEAERLLIFGDNDEKHAGQSAAYALAARLSSRLEVEVHIPEKPGRDWNDVLVERGSA
jgi:putative DNA primase/helicase